MEVEVGDLVVVEEVMGLVEVEEEDLEVMVEVVAMVEVVEVEVDRSVDAGALEEEGAKVLLVEWVEWEGLEE